VITVNTESARHPFKSHAFCGVFAKFMKKKIKSTGAEFKLSESIFFDIAMYRLKEEFDSVDWDNEVKVNHFLEHLLVDIFEIQKHHVTVQIRNLPKKEKK